MFSAINFSQLKKNIRVHKAIWVVFGAIGMIAITQTTNWSLDDKINSKHQEILDLKDQIKQEEAKINEIKEKYSIIRFWQNKSREDIIALEKAKTKIKILDAKRSELEDERAELKKAIGQKWMSTPPWISPLFKPFIVIWVVYFLYICYCRYQSEKLTEIFKHLFRIHR